MGSQVVQHQIFLTQQKLFCTCTKRTWKQTGPTVQYSPSPRHGAKTRPQRSNIWKTEINPLSENESWQEPDFPFAQTISVQFVRTRFETWSLLWVCLLTGAFFVSVFLLVFFFFLPNLFQTNDLVPCFCTASFSSSLSSLVLRTKIHFSPSKTSTVSYSGVVTTPSAVYFYLFICFVLFQNLRQKRWWRFFPQSESDLRWLLLGRIALSRRENSTLC